MKRLFYILTAALTLVSCEREGEYAGIPDGSANKGGILYTVNIDELAPGTPLEDFHVFIFDSLNNAVLHEYFPTPLHLGKEMLLIKDGGYTSVVILNVEETFLYTDYDRTETKNQRNKLDLTLSELTSLLYRQEIKYPDMCSGLEEFHVIKEEKVRPVFSMKNGIDGFREILILPDDLTISWEGGSFEIPILLNMEISKVEIKHAEDGEMDEWITTNNSESTKAVEELVLKFNADMNLSDKRDAFIIVTSGDNVDSIKVEQNKATAQIVLGAGQPRLHLIESYNITPITVVFTSPTNWKAEFSEDTPETWSISKTSGTKGRTESFVITLGEGNLSDTDILAAVNITPEGGAFSPITIRQYKVAKLTFDEETFLLSLNSTKTQKFKSARPWNIEVIEGGDWCTVTEETWDKTGSGSSSFDITAEQNVGDNRDAKFRVTSNAISQEITITQSKLLNFTVGGKAAASTDGSAEEETLEITGSITDLKVQIPGAASGINLAWTATIIDNNSVVAGFRPIKLDELGEVSNVDIATKIITPIKVSQSSDNVLSRRVTVQYICSELKQYINIILYQPVARGKILNSSQGTKFVVSDRNLGVNVPSFGDEIEAKYYSNTSPSTNQSYKGDYYNWEEAKSACKVVGWRLPTNEELTIIFSQLRNDTETYHLQGSDGVKYYFHESGSEAQSGGVEGNYWSNTSPISTNVAWSMSVRAKQTQKEMVKKAITNRYSVRCVHTIVD